MKIPLYRMRWGRLWAWAIGLVLMGVVIGWLVKPAGAPVAETDLDAAPAILVERLQGKPWHNGFFRVTVDGRTFLLYASFSHAALVEYEPAGPGEGGGE